MRQITREELENLPSYPLIEQALFFGTDAPWQPNASKRNWPWETTDKYPEGF